MDPRSALHVEGGPTVTMPVDLAPERAATDDADKLQAAERSAPSSRRSALRIMRDGLGFGLVALGVLATAVAPAYAAFRLFKFIFAR